MANNCRATLAGEHALALSMPDFLEEETRAKGFAFALISESAFGAVNGRLSLRFLEAILQHLVLLVVVEPHDRVVIVNFVEQVVRVDAGGRSGAGMQGHAWDNRVSLLFLGIDDSMLSDGDPSKVEGARDIALRDCEITVLVVSEVPPSPVRLG